MPTDGIGAEEVAKEAGHIPQAVRLVPVDGVVVFRECLLEQVSPQPVQLCKSLPNETEKF